MYQDKIVLCGANSYEEKFYMNPDFDNLPQHIKDELKIMCVLYVHDVGGILTLVFEENGELEFEVTSAEGDPMFDEIDSTNNRAKALGEAGGADGTLFVAETQTAGKGRRGRCWQSPAGSSISMSILLRPVMNPSDAPMLTLVMAYAATKALREKTELDIGIKWPNDLVVSGKKISGILTEMSAEIDYINHVVIGIGINVNMESFPEDIAKTATSLRIEAGKEFRRFELIAAIMEHFEKAYEAVCEAGSLEPIMEDYNRLLVNCGRRVRVLEPEHEYDALALGIDKTGELQVECEDGSRKSVFAGEVSVRGIYGYV